MLKQNETEDRSKKCSKSIKCQFIIVRVLFESQFPEQTQWVRVWNKSLDGWIIFLPSVRRHSRSWKLLDFMCSFSLFSSYRLVCMLYVELNCRRRLRPTTASKWIEKSSNHLNAIQYRSLRNEKLLMTIFIFFFRIWFSLRFQSIRTTQTWKNLIFFGMIYYLSLMLHKHFLECSNDNNYLVQLHFVIIPH